MTEQPSASRGWIVTYAGFSINLVLGVLYAWGVMGKALVGQWHWDRTAAAWPFTAATIAFSIMMIFAGRMQDRIGPRKTATLGGLMLGAGLIATAYVTTPMMMMITFGIIGGIGIGLGYSATTPPALKWFPPARKGLIAGIVVSGVGLAAVVWAPVTDKMLTVTSISNTFLIFGVIATVVVCALATFLVNPPAGYIAAVAAPAPGQAKSAPVARREIDWREMVQTVTFWKLWIVMVLSASAGLMIIATIPLIAKDQAPLAAGFKMVVLVALFNTAGRLVGGFCSDKIGRTNTMMLFFTLQAINMFCFSHYTTTELLYFGSAFTGLCYGTVFTLFPAATADYYGIRNLGVNYGCVFTAFGVAGTVGPILAGWIRKTYGSYSGAYLACAVMLLAAVVLAFTTKAPRQAAVETPGRVPEKQPV